MENKVWEVDRLFLLCKPLMRAGSDPKARFWENIWFWLQWAGKYTRRAFTSRRTQ